VLGMNDKVVVITGANRGVGFVAARELAAAGACIVMVCRDERRGEAARAAIAEVATGRPPELLLADLSVQEDVHAVAEEIRGRHERLDVLLNNAGAVFSKRELTADGIERTFATNHLGPFLLTKLVLDLVTAAPAGRVVTVATEVYAKRLRLDNLQGEDRYQFFKAYQHSKLCNVLFAFELARRLEGTPATSNVVSPGPTRTGFGEELTGAGKAFTTVMKRLPVFGPPERGARTLVYAAADPALDGVSGRFFFKSRELETRPVTHDLQAAATLWAICEDLTGLVTAHV